jgi:hypothetical protein
MNINLENSFQSPLGRLLPFFISLLDDALIIGLSRLGLKLPWLHWLSPIVMIGMAIVWFVQMLRSQWFQRIFVRKFL